MTDFDDGGPAFPHTITEGPAQDLNFPYDYDLGGISIWDYYAAAALSAVPIRSWEHIGDGDQIMFAWANASALAADAMLAERRKRCPDPEPKQENERG